MHKFKEELLQSIWKKRTIGSTPLYSVSGKEIKIVRPGELNADAGPDFSNAQVMVDGMLLAGNVEIHIRSSDWLKHHHQDDPAYDRLILHVVFEHDVELDQNKAHNVEVLELKKIIDPALLFQATEMQTSPVICARQFAYVNATTVTECLEELVIKRLEQKIKRIESLFEFFRGDYRQTFYTLLLRSFGANINSTPFELLAKNLPLSLLLRHADNLTAVEALVFGTAGLLDQQYQDNYVSELQNEYSFLSRKYGLKSLDANIIKFSKMRPANFPTLRLAQFAALVHSAPALINAPQLFLTYDEILKAFSFTTSSFWRNHYTLSGNATAVKTNLGKSGIENLIINTFAPFLYFYGLKRNSVEVRKASIQLLRSCQPENNFKTRAFPDKEHFNNSALRSQALIQLYDNYCTCKRCLSCRIGSELLSA